MADRGLDKEVKKALMTIKYTKHAETSLRERKNGKDVVDGPQRSRNIGRENDENKI